MSKNVSKRNQKKETKQGRTTRVVASLIALLLAVLMLGSVLVGSLTSLAITKSEVDNLKQQASQASAKKSQLKQQLANLSSSKNNTSKQVELLDQQIEAAEDEIAIQEQLVENLSQLVAEKTQELDTSQKALEGQYEKTRERVRFMAEHGEQSYLEILLSAESFFDFLNRFEIVRQVSSYDQTVFDDLKKAKDTVQQQKESLESSLADEQSTQQSLESNKAALEKQRTEKTQKLQSLENQQSETSASYAAAIEEAEALMEKYQKAAAELAAQTTYVGGTFMWPLPASNNVVTCKYGYRIHPVTGKYSLHTGVDLRASTGTKIYASLSGTVVLSKYDSTWGNYVIINHGGGYTSLYAHMTKRNVSEGDKASQGQVIGYVGSTGWSTGAHLHFELRKNGASYDPLKEFPKFNVIYK